MDNGIEDFFDETDSEESSSFSSPPFDNQPFIFKLHELSKDEQDPANPIVEKVKRLKKKKGQPANRVDKSATSISSTSVSDASSLSRTIDDTGREEFYDAHESYHIMQPNQQITKPVVGAGQLQVRSEHNQDPKLVSDTQAQLPSVTSRDPSTTVSKPVTRPN